MPCAGKDRTLTHFPRVRVRPRDSLTGSGDAAACPTALGRRSTFYLCLPLLSSPKLHRGPVYIDLDYGRLLALVAIRVFPVRNSGPCHPAK